MKHIVAIALLLSLTLCLAPLGSEAAPSLISISACQASNGMYQVSVEVNPETWAHVHTNDPVQGWVCHGILHEPTTIVLADLPAGLVEAWADDMHEFSETSITTGPGTPSCGKASHGGARPLFDMWLLTGGGKYCILISETHPSVERQKALCFPGEDWVAEKVACTGTLYDNDTWECDDLGKARAHAADLMMYDERH